MARLKALPCQTAEQEIAEQLAIQTIQTQTTASEAILEALNLVHGAARRQTHRKAGDRAMLEQDFRARRPDEPPPKMATDEGGHAAMIEEGDAPLWGENDPKTRVPRG